MKNTNFSRFQLISFLILFVALNGFLIAQSQDPDQITKDDNSKFINIGNLGLTITNFGSYGNGFALWPNQPSCEYPLGSGIEHIFDGGLWVGSFKSTDSLHSNRQGPYVTTASVDASSVSSRGGGFEWTNAKDDLMKERSSLINSKFYDPVAISHQDLYCNYTDTNTTFLNGEVIVDHNPLGLAVRQEAYAWNFPFADYFVIMNYWIKNVSNTYLDSVYVGLWQDPVVRNTKITPPRGAAFFAHGGNGYSQQFKMAYEYDSNGDVGFTDSYVGFMYLGSTIQFDSANFVSWQYKNVNDPIFFAPPTDIERYYKMTGFFANNVRWNYGVTPPTLKTASNRSELITVGPFKYIKPGDSVNVVYAIVCAKKFGTGLAADDTEEQKKTLYSNADWALRAYYGNDKNRNGICEPSEDIFGDGKIHRYILPAPPASPKVKVINESNKVTIYWDKSSEKSVDPISGVADFEGYNLYRTSAGADLNPNQNYLESLVKLVEYDSTGNKLFFDTGFKNAELKQAMKFEGDPNEYWYKFEINNLLNGWQYLFSVTAFDEGDPINKIESLESSALYNLQRVVPGTPATSSLDTEIGVYPNPYYGNAVWDGSNERLRKIYFFNLPKTCDITIYTLSGDIVRKISHDPASNGSDTKWFQNYAGDGKQQMSGGEHAWDLITDSDQAIATGLYLFTVKDKETGNLKTGKFLIIK